MKNVREKEKEASRLGQNNRRASLSVQPHIKDESDLDVSCTKTHHSCRDFYLNTPGNHIMGIGLLQIVNSYSYCCHGSVVRVCVCV